MSGCPPKKYCKQNSRHVECETCQVQYPRKKINLDTNHEHFDEMCHNCKEIIPAAELKTHACALKLFAAPKSYIKIACYDFETSAHRKRKTDKKIHEPVFLSCYFETEQICHFSQINFASDKMEFHEVDGVLLMKRTNFYPSTVLT